MQTERTKVFAAEYLFNSSDVKATASGPVSQQTVPGTPRFAAECRAYDMRPLAYRFAKRAFDVAFSVCVIAIGLIPGLVLCVTIAADTKGSPIYSQKRAGHFGRPIRIYKFRSMVADADNIEKYLTAEQVAEWQRERKVTNDPRITKLGHVCGKIGRAHV